MNIFRVPLVSRLSYAKNHLKFRNLQSQQNVKFQKGDELHNFVVDEVTPVSEMYLTAIKLTHRCTGAQYLHLSRDDSNNVFSVGFRTTPRNSTGVPHILEHLALCGSQKYPCRDPFFKMLRRSLATYMNAATGPDFTFYPFSTQNLQDYRNLQSVYLDSVFRPTLHKLDFQQEGWRMEHKDLNNKNSDIVFKGIVFNEMKGVFNNNHNVFAEKLLNTILPSHTYGVISGGDPLIIPNLEYQDLLDFHSTYYHPSNTHFYSYGNFPLEDSLEYINQNYLSSFNKIDNSASSVPSEPRWAVPKTAHYPCRPDPLIADPKRQNLIAIANLCNDITDIQQTFDIHVLSQLLLDGPNSAFYKSLIDTNMGTGFGPMTGYESQIKDTMFILSLQGVQSEDFTKIEKIYEDTVNKVIEEGFDQRQVDTVLHGIELRIKHQSSNFGLNLLYGVTPIWNHDGDVVQSLKINQSMGAFKNKIKSDPKYLQSLVEKYLAKNSHKLVLTMSPTEDYEEKLNAAENQLLKSKIDKLSEKELEKVYENGLILAKEQEKKENLDILPTLTMADLKKDVDRYAFEDIEVSQVPIQVSVQPTNGVSYYRAILGTRNLPQELKSLLPVFNDVVTKMGTENYDYRLWDQEMQLKTGGFYFSSHIAEQKDDSNLFEEGILAYSYCLDANSCDMWRLWGELFNRVKLTDLERFETLVKIHAADVASTIANKGHNYAMLSASSLVSPVAKQKEILSGLEYVNRLKQIAQLDDLSSILVQVQQIAELVLKKSHMRSSLNLCDENRQQVLSGIEGFYDSLEGSRTKKEKMLTKEEVLKSGNFAVQHVLPYDVNYAAKAILTVPYSHPDFAALQLLAQLLSSFYLHTQIREKGGAYGGGAKMSSDGIFMFYSYRDPNSTKTLDVFDGSYDFLSKYAYPENEITEAKLGLFQKIDSPVAPSNRTMLRFLHDYSYDDVQRYREKLKIVTTDDLMRVAEKYLNPDAKLRVGRTLLGPHNPDLNSRRSENWVILDQEKKAESQAQAL